MSIRTIHPPVALLVLAMSGIAAAAETWPTHSIRLVVPFAPGGSTDTLARTIGQKLSDTLGQQVLLAKDTTIVAAVPGEVLDGLYRVESIDDRGISLTYLPLGRKVVIELKP